MRGEILQIILPNQHSLHSFMIDPFELPTGAHIGGISLNVRSLDLSVSFYSQVLGFHLLTRQGGEAALAAGIDSRPLITLFEKAGAKPKPSGTTGLYHLAILYPTRESLGTALHTLLSQEYQVRGASNHGVSEAIYLADPDKNGIELYADLPREEWKWVGNEVQMVTDPLDVERLLEESPPVGPAPMPPRTTIGHVHLQVSDLGRSEHVYRDLLGFKVTQSSYPGARFLAAGEYHHHIGLNIWGGAGAPAPPPDCAGIRSFTISIPGKRAFERLVAHLNSSGVDVFPEVSPATGLEYCLDDSDGIRIVISLEGEAEV